MRLAQYVLLVGLLVGAIVGAGQGPTGHAQLTIIAPSNLTATTISSSSIFLQWHDNSTNETGFQIQR